MKRGKTRPFTAPRQLVTKKSVETNEKTTSDDDDVPIASLNKTKQKRVKTNEETKGEADLGSDSEGDEVPISKTLGKDIRQLYNMCLIGDLSQA